MTTVTRSTGPRATTPTSGQEGSRLTGPQLEQLTKSNPRLGELITANPGLGKFLEKNTVSSGPRPGESRTEVAWDFWTHSAKTNQKYGHGLTDEQITNDYIVAFQPSPDAGASVNLGRASFKGHEIVGVYQAGQEMRGRNTAYDGGHLGTFDLVAHGKKGEAAVLGWAIISVGPDGNVRGGGFPTARNGVMVPYQDQKSGDSGGGGEYHGRAARITHGRTDNFVPIVGD
jgi:hypothetical protein